MTYSLRYFEHVDPLPPSYSAVMAEKELSPLNINIKQTSYEAQKMVQIIQLQSDMLQWKNSYYLEKIEEMNACNTTQDILNDKISHMNDLLEKLIHEAETTLYTAPCLSKKKRKKKHTNYALLESQYIESQQKLDMTLKEIMQAIQAITTDTPPYTSSLSSFVHYAFSNTVDSPKQKNPTKKLGKTVKVQAMLFTIILIIHTFDSRHRSRWTKRGHDVLFIWKHRSKAQHQLWINKAQLALFVFQLICKYGYR